MSAQSLQQILSSTIHQKIVLACLLSVCAIILLGVGIFQFRKTLQLTKKNNKKERRVAQKKISQFKLEIILSLILLVALFILYVPWFVAAFHDLHQQQFIQISCSYERGASPASRRDWLSNGHVRVTVEGVVLKLELPAGWTEEQFPCGVYNGLACYSVESKIILHFRIEE